MNRKRTKEKQSKARPFSRARLVLLLCAVSLGAMMGGMGAEYAFSFRQAPYIFQADVPSRFPPSSHDQAETRTDINQADMEALRQVRGIGPSLAQAILDFRDALGGFHYLEEIKDVPGIGDSRYAALKELFFCSPP